MSTLKYTPEVIKRALVTDDEMKAFRLTKLYKEREFVLNNLPITKNPHVQIATRIVKYLILSTDKLTPAHFVTMPKGSILYHAYRGINLSGHDSDLDCHKDLNDFAKVKNKIFFGLSPDIPGIMVRDHAYDCLGHFLVKKDFTALDFRPSEQEISFFTDKYKFSPETAELYAVMFPNRIDVILFLQEIKMLKTIFFSSVKRTPAFHKTSFRPDLMQYFRNSFMVLTRNVYYHFNQVWENSAGFFQFTMINIFDYIRLSIQKYNYLGIIKQNWDIVREHTHSKIYSKGFELHGKGYPTKDNISGERINLFPEFILSLSDKYEPMQDWRNYITTMPVNDPRIDHQGLISKYEIKKLP